MRKIFTSQASKELLRGDVRALDTFVIPRVEEEIPKVICRHHSYCSVRQFGRINCLTQSSIQGCQTYKFFERYPNYKELGVGSRI